MKIRTLSGVGVIVLYLVLASSAPFGQVAGPAQPPAPSFDPDEDVSEYLPPGAGKGLVMTECIECHKLNRIVALRKSPDEWKVVLAKMKDEGARLSEDKVSVIVDYLGDALGSKAPPLIDVNTASPDDLVKLPGVTMETANRLIKQRNDKGLFSSRDEVKSTLQFDDTAFEKLKWYLRARGTGAPFR